MKRIIARLLLTIAVLGTAMMHGQATRTWVSGVGDDGNPCSRTAPCKTFAGALAKTAAGGEIDALDPGGFGAVAITKAVTIDGGGGQVASDLVVGINAITIQAGPNDVVELRNIRLNGIGRGASGIEFVSGGLLLVENCFINDFLQNGIDVSLSANGSVHVSHTTINNVGQVGIRAANSSGTTQLRVSDSQITLTNIGIEASDQSSVVISNSVVDNASAVGVQADTSSGGTVVFISNSDLSFNGAAVQSGPGAVQVSVSHSRLAFNGTKLVRAGGNIFVDDIEGPPGDN